MKKTRLIFLLIMLILLCSGCKATYTLDYHDDFFKERLVIEDVSSAEEKNFSRYEDEASLVIDKDNSYIYENKDDRKEFSYDIGKKLKSTPLLKYCFEKVYIVENKDYINIKTDGDFYCHDYDIKLKLDTDKKIVNSNSSSNKNGIYYWDKLDDGINVLISKEKFFQDSDKIVKKNIKETLIRLVITIVFLVIVTIVLIRFKKNYISE